ncbi:MAG: serpin family protein [Bacteroidota bacterium]|nr:serpin family protein [Bacteroidota bacterium]
MKTLLWGISLMVAILTGGCNKSDSPVIGPLNLTPSQKSLLNSSNTFGLKLFSQLTSETGAPDNVFISPLSVSMALTMTYNGAANDTRDSMRNVLGFNEMTDADINQTCHDLVSVLGSADPKVSMEIANSIWYDQKFKVLPDFLNINRTYFDAEVSKADFTNTATVSLINNWVDNKTNHKITSIINSIPPEILMYLINAVYFKGAWKYEFDKAKTSQQNFILADGSNYSTDFMVQKGTFEYYQNADFSAVDLPYGNGNFSMMVLVPNAGKDYKTILSNLNTANWNAWNNSLTNANVQVYLPKFKTTYKNELDKSLTNMGMGIAFSDVKADFSGIDGNHDLYISTVLHKTYADINEEGTEAAAVTVVGVGVTSVGPGESTIIFRADKPFIFVIKEKQTNSLLFMGLIRKPSVN